MHVAVRRLCDADDAAEVPVYHGVSYCQAMRRAGAGEALRVVPGSITVCRWSRVVLGHKPPKGRFETGLVPRLPYPHAGLLLAPLDGFPGEPEVVVVRAPMEAMRRLIEAVPAADLWAGHAGRLDRSALPLLMEGQNVARGQGRVVRGHIIAAVNRTLATLAPLPAWQTLTHRLFRSQAVTAGFEAILARALASMSMCRNSTVVPLRTGQANVSFFCTGGITWGRNRATYLTSGWPLSMYQSRIDSFTNLPSAPGVTA